MLSQFFDLHILHPWTSYQFTYNTMQVLALFLRSFCNADHKLSASYLKTALIVWQTLQVYTFKSVTYCLVTCCIVFFSPSLLLMHFFLLIDFVLIEVNQSLVASAYDLVHFCAKEFEAFV